jgi:RNA polymerase sigma-70 factor (ECF subfamily)
VSEFLRTVKDPVPDGAVVSAVPEAFEDFFEAESGTLFRRLCVITGNSHDAEEIMQDAFLALWERWDRVRVLEDPTGYLYRTAMNAFRKRYRRALLALKRTMRPSTAEEPFSQIDTRESVVAALAGLTDRQRAALVLTEILGYSSEEAARALGVRAVTIRTLASRGRTALRSSLEDAQ